MLSKGNVAAAALLLITVGSANAGAFDCARGYFGGEVSVYNHTSYNSDDTTDLNRFKTSNTASELAIQSSKPGLNVFAGLRFNDYLGGEIGFGFIQEVTADVQNNQSATNKVSNIYLDAIGYLPVSAKVDLLGSLGVGGLKSNPDVTNTTFINKNSLSQIKIGYRIGAGAQYYANRNFALRAVLRYQSGNQDFLRYLTSISLGALYTFG